MYYAVKEGKKTGIFKTWDECKDSVTGYSGAVYKKFKTQDEASNFIHPKGEFGKKMSWDNDVESTEKSKTTYIMHEGKVLFTGDNRPDIMEEPGVLHAYVDGSYRSNGYCGYGVIILKDNDNYLTLSGELKHNSWQQFRNISGEVVGSIVAINKAATMGAKRIIIYHDYMGVASWITGDFKANSEIAKYYVDTVKQLVERNPIDIKFVKVKSHTGVYYNEVADKLAGLNYKG